MEGRAHDLEQTPTEPDAGDEPTLSTCEVLSAQPPLQRVGEPDTATPSVAAEFWPRAAGGGAGGVVAPAGLREPDIPEPPVAPEFWPRAAGGGAGGVIAPVVVTGELPRPAAAEPDPVPPELQKAGREPVAESAATDAAVIALLPADPAAPGEVIETVLPTAAPPALEALDTPSIAGDQPLVEHATLLADDAPPVRRLEAIVEPAPAIDVVTPASEPAKGEPVPGAEQQHSSPDPAGASRPLLAPPEAEASAPEPVVEPSHLDPMPVPAIVSEPQPIEATPVRASMATPALPQPLPDIWRTEALPPARWKEPLPQPARDRPRGARRFLRLALTAAALAVCASAALLLGLILLYRWVDPPASALMLGQRLAGMPITQRWVPLDRISSNLLVGVIVAEDSQFCRHRGVDWGELREAIESAGDGMPRGGSTISMQVVKNLFLWPSKSYVRKAIEIPLAYLIEAAWSKRRILEIYLNIAEWGPGIFGADAASRYHFRKPALLLNAREAALLAVSLPNPFERDAGRPGAGTLRLADNLLLRMRGAQGHAACVRSRLFSQ